MPKQAPLFFETKRLLFRPFIENDLEPLYAISANADVSRYVGDGTPLSREQTHKWINTSRANITQYGFGTGAIVDKETGHLIGWGGFARPKNEPIEIIYGFDKPYWGQGLGGEFLAGVITYGFEQLDLTQIRATVYPQNIGSISILKRANFELRDTCYMGEDDTHLYVLDRPSP